VTSRQQAACGKLEQAPALQVRRLVMQYGGSNSFPL
jgi:hypothetical protein